MPLWGVQDASQLMHELLVSYSNHREINVAFPDHTHLNQEYLNVGKINSLSRVVFTE